MNKLTCLFLCLVALSSTPGFGQSTEKTEKASAPLSPQLTRFDLDFRGGTPGELVAAIEKASGRPLNAIVPVEHATRKLPPLKMKNVDAAQLFEALQSAAKTRIAIPLGRGQLQMSDLQYGFHTIGSVSDDSVWSFYVVGEPVTGKLTRFYLLTPYLNGGLTVDDITTAIQTGWRMRGDATPPTLSFHKETKLLIAVGDYAGLDTIEAVLKALDAVKVSSAPAAADKPADERKTKQ